MSRSGYSDYAGDDWSLIRYRGQVASATRGKRGQKLLVELLEALDAMPVKQLIAGDLVDDEGGVCALGALGQARGMNMGPIDGEPPEAIGDAFDIAWQLAAEVQFMNDDWGYDRNPSARWRKMREWTAKQILPGVVPGRGPDPQGTKEPGETGDGPMRNDG